ncbi:MAG: hypothetical protein FWC77_05975 [Defluviitaleaceae bacterium]|nr:hypothetical protein [Defluviitaleaceae bacterium]
MKTQHGHAKWLKIVITLLFFVPAYTQLAHDPAEIPDVIAYVLSDPFVVQVTWLLPIFKLLLLGAVLLPLIGPARLKFSNRITMGYYAFILLVVGIFQNMANTTAYGFVFLIGNALVQFIVLGFCAHDFAKGKTKINKMNFNANRIWIIPLMLLAFFMPYSADCLCNIYPAITLGVFYNEAGVTYCMITPVVIGVMLLYSKGVDKATLSVMSYVGLLFGIMNMVTWFGINRDNWWMGVLHLPLLVISVYGLVVAHKEAFYSPLKKL